MVGERRGREGEGGGGDAFCKVLRNHFQALRAERGRRRRSARNVNTGGAGEGWGGGGGEAGVGGGVAVSGGSGAVPALGWPPAPPWRCLGHECAAGAARRR